MFVTKVKLTNWRNFRSAEVSLRDVNYIIAPNAAGKSNFLDVFRFLRDIAKPSGGGLQKAVESRGTLKKLRCLHARKTTFVGIEIEVSTSIDDAYPLWRYELTFNSEGTGKQRPAVAKEVVCKFNTDGSFVEVLKRPSAEDEADKERLTQTALEQIQANQKFRDLAEFFGQVTYVHLVPQLLKFAELNTGRLLEDDPFGQGFLERVAKTPEKTRNVRLSRIGAALKNIIHHMEELRFSPDESTGMPHLEAKFKHHRPHGAIQREDQFSDGTLRLIALFWLLLEGQSMLLLEEPELSLNDDIVRRLPKLFAQVQKHSKKKRQIIITTHSDALLSNAGIDPRGIHIMVPSEDGTTISLPQPDEIIAMEAGFSPAEAVLPRVRNLSSHGDPDQWKLAL
jgi:predicted ATPase